jgi:hypothetical protein
MNGLDAVRERLEVLTHETHSEVLTFAPGGAQSPQALHDAPSPVRGRTASRNFELTVIEQAHRHPWPRPARPGLTPVLRTTILRET